MIPCILHILYHPISWNLNIWHLGGDLSKGNLGSIKWSIDVFYYDFATLTLAINDSVVLAPQSISYLKRRKTWQCNNLKSRTACCRDRLCLASREVRQDQIMFQQTLQDWLECLQIPRGVTATNLEITVFNMRNLDYNPTMVDEDSEKFRGFRTWNFPLQQCQPDIAILMDHILVYLVFTIIALSMFPCYPLPLLFLSDGVQGLRHFFTIT